jgi:hypothetical protein
MLDKKMVLNLAALITSSLLYSNDLQQSKIIKNLEEKLNNYDVQVYFINKDDNKDDFEQILLELYKKDKKEPLKAIFNLNKSINKNNVIVEKKNLKEEGVSRNILSIYETYSDSFGNRGKIFRGAVELDESKDSKYEVNSFIKNAKPIKSSRFEPMNECNDFIKEYPGLLPNSEGIYATAFDLNNDRKNTEFFTVSINKDGESIKIIYPTFNFVSGKSLKTKEILAESDKKYSLKITYDDPNRSLLEVQLPKNKDYNYSSKPSFTLPILPVERGKNLVDLSYNKNKDATIITFCQNKLKKEINKYCVSDEKNVECDLLEHAIFSKEDAIEYSNEFIPLITKKGFIELKEIYSKNTIGIYRINKHNNEYVVSLKGNKKTLEVKQLEVYKSFYDKYGIKNYKKIQVLPLHAQLKNILIDPKEDHIEIKYHNNELIKINYK